ncbi:MAG: methyltransferase domain-containing protein [Candidatus Yanofskybacteria bacterium]|nr:methyltransferase domain-containing protein [Candidatus Yanofskybacteria bacterium]
MRFRKKIYNFAKKLVFQRNLLSYELHGRKPWSRGYFEYKWREIGAVLKNNDLLKLFKNGEKLPEKYGVGVDERIVEIPWIISQIGGDRVEMLDAGSALNFVEIVEHKNVASKNLFVMNLNPESNCFWKKGVSYVYGDIRKAPFKSDNFDIISCVSTLEHIGMDNTQIYTGEKQFKENNGDYLPAVLEMKRMLKPGGTLFITVPFGQYENHGFFQQFDLQMVQKIIDAFGAASCESVFYKYSKNGWQISDEARCSDAKYFNIHKDKQIDEDYAAAARAVVCIILKK